MLKPKSTKILLALLGCGLCFPLVAQENEPPSAALLEFLAEFNDTDERTFELILYHGKEDIERQIFEKTIGQEGIETSIKGSEL